MKAPAAKVFIVDDDASFRTSLARLLASHGFETELFDSAASFMKCGLAHRVGCIVLDIRMPSLSGLDLQLELARVEGTMPIIFLTGHGSIPTGVHAMKMGAADFLTKPVDEEVLIPAIQKALAENRRRNGERAQVEGVRARIRTLTEREHEVMLHIIAGELNKQIAGDLGTVEQTIKVHRRRVLEKMGVVSVAELVWLCAQAGVGPAAKK